MYGTQRSLFVAVLLAGCCVTPCHAQFTRMPGKKPGAGVVGNQGQGNQGFQGVQGFQGMQGFQGNQGFQGFQGFQGNQGNQGFQGNNGQNTGTPTQQGSWYQNGRPLPIFTGTFLGKQQTTLEVYDNLLTRLQYQQALTSGNFGGVQGGTGAFQGGVGNFQGGFGNFQGGFNNFQGSFGQFTGNPFVGGQFQGNPFVGAQFGGQFAGNAFGPQAVAGYVGGGYNFAQPPMAGGLLGNPGLGFVGFGR